MRKKKYIKKTKKRARARISLFGWTITLLLLVGLLIFGRHLYNNIHVVDTSLTGAESIETQQNTIPKDVQAKLDKENHVLGSKTSWNAPFLTIPVTVRVPILMYHYVEYVEDPGDKIRISLNTTPFTLEQEIKTLQDAGYTFITNKELADAMDGKAKLPPKPILLTFDDGYRDFYTDAYPILKKYHVKATQYVIAGFLDQPNHLLTTQLKEIAQDGLVEIGAHTVHHLWLKGLPISTVTFEVAQSKKMLEQIIQKPVVSFAYPFGAFDIAAVDAVKSAGFRTAVSTIPGIDQLQPNRYFLFRLRPGGRTGQYLLTWLDNVHNSQ